MGLFSKAYSAGILGVEGYLVEVEADVSDGLPQFSMVGYLSSEVREAGDRVRTALRNSGFRIPAKKITINLSPADVRKEGTAFDLPVAVAVLTSLGVIEPGSLKGSAMVGELGLDGRIKPMRGALSIVAALKEAGIRRVFLPQENVREGSVVDGIDVIGVGSVKELMDLLNFSQLAAPAMHERQEFTKAADSYGVDYEEVSGQTFLKRATEIAVAGMHNLLYIGPAGAGKTMMAKRIPTIMPSISMEENIEISKIYSICGLLLPEQPLLSKRPFRCPHHTISPQALAGGGRIPRPGEISLASKGVLFLDELPEFKKGTLEILRQPLEERKITISRVHGAYEYPADFMLVAAMNPCRCGFYPDHSRCTCTETEVRHYLNRISKPLLDRFDICAEAASITYEEIQGGGSRETSSVIRERVERARNIQEERFRGRSIYFNCSMREQEIKEYCRLDKREEEFLRQVFCHYKLSARSYSKILKVSRTIADLEGGERITQRHLAEAVGLRSLEEKYWGSGYGENH